ncbi:hypothetical protein [Bacillus sp. FSL K6-6540]|uniref:hypothetical protein n=1 Tax=Bacillus sp. FSL K6-6540 TaxID=2921512 RepID=UPI0030F8947C
MSNRQGKTYYIPRKVTEGIKFAGLNVKQMLFMLPFVGVAVIIDIFTTLPTGGKVMLTTLLVSTSYALVALELGNGLYAQEYVKLLIRYYLFSQNVYTLTTTKSRPSEDDKKIRVLAYHRENYTSASEQDHSTWEYEDKLKNQGSNIIPDDPYEGLEEYMHLIPEPKKQ